MLKVLETIVMKFLVPAVMTYVKRAASEEMVGLVLQESIDAAVRNTKTPHDDRIAARAKKILGLNKKD